MEPASSRKALSCQIVAVIIFWDTVAESSDPLPSNTTCVMAFLQKAKSEYICPVAAGAHGIIFALSRQGILASAHIHVHQRLAQLLKATKAAPNPATDSEGPRAAPSSPVIPAALSSNEKAIVTKLSVSMQVHEKRIVLQASRAHWLLLRAPRAKG